MITTIRIGIWIDHKNAMIVSPDINSNPKVSKVSSGYEGKERRAGDNQKYLHGGTHYMNESSFENRHKETLKKFYSKIMSEIPDGAELFIFGPSSAKRELSKAIRENTFLKAKIICVETADYMTEKQIIAKVKEYFALAL